MPISTTGNTALLAGNSSTVVFPYSYPFYNTADLQVYLFDTVGGTITPQTLGAHYSVSATADSTGIYPNGGNVIFNSSVINTSIVVIDRNPVQTQTFNILQSGYISSVGLVHQLDYLTLLIQSLQDQMTRAVSLPEGFGATFNTNLPSQISSTAFAGCFISVNSGANGLSLTNSSLVQFTPATQGFILTGNGANVFPSFQPLNLAQSGVVGTLSLGNGGTGGLTPSPWGVVYASSVTQLATTAPGPVGLPLLANASSAPSYQKLPYATAGSGVIGIGLGGTGLAAYVGNQLLQSGSSGTALLESPFITQGSGLLFGDGGLTRPAIGFLNETNTGFYRAAAADVVLGLKGNIAFEATLAGSNVNLGFGVAASNSIQVPLLSSADYNGTQYFQYGNTNQGANSVTVFQINNGTVNLNNATTVENWAWNTANAYLGGGSVIAATVNQTQFNIVAEGTGGIRLNVGGRDFAHEKVRLSTSSMTFQGGYNLILGGSGASAISLTLPATMASRNGDMIYCGSGGVFTQLAIGSSGTLMQSNGVGSAPSWVSPSSTTNTIPVAVKTASYNATSADFAIIANSGCPFITLTSNPATGAQLHLKYGIQAYTGNPVIINGSGQLNVADGYNVNSSTVLYTPGEAVKVVYDGTQWQVLERNIANVTGSSVPTIGNMGSVTSNIQMSYRERDQLVVQGSFICGTPTTGSSQIGVFYQGVALTVDTAKVPGGTMIGNFLQGTPSGSYCTVLAPPTNQTYVNFGIGAASNNAGVAISGSGFYTSGISFQYVFRVPIVGWRG